MGRPRGSTRINRFPNCLLKFNSTTEKPMKNKFQFLKALNQIRLNVLLLAVYVAFLSANYSNAQFEIVVDQNGSGDFVTIQEALDSLQKVGNQQSVTIVVKPGVYTEPLTVPQIGCEIMFLTIISCDPSDPNIVNSTEIDCSMGALIHSSDPGKQNALLTVSGIKLTNGVAGAVQIFDAFALFEDCIFDGNSNFFDGGAISQNDGGLQVNRCEFTNNQTFASGGAVAFSGGDGSLFTSVDSNFSNNMSAEIGGAIATDGDGGAVIENTSFENNTSISEGGAISTEGNVAPEIRDSTFSNNTGANGGGALGFFLNQDNGGSTFKFNGPVTQGFVNDCTFDTNIGGAVFIDGNSPPFMNCVFRKNTSALAGGAMLVFPESEVQLINCIFDGNQTEDFGGAILNFDATVEIVNCTIVRNSAALGGDSIAATNAANTNIVNSIIFFNGGEMNVVEGGGGEEGSSFIVTFSVVEGGFPGAGNLNVDPQFVDLLGPDGIASSGDEDLSLHATSPAIDAANNDELPLDVFDIDADGDFGELLPFDVLSNARFVDHPDVADSGNGSGPIVDMGAIEFQVKSPILLGDVNLDGVVNLLDVSPFIDRISTGTFQSEADTNQDGVVNLLDVNPFIAILAGG